jgi:hypothetical protein
VEEVERILALRVAGIEGLYPLDRGGDDRRVVLPGLGRRVGEVAQHREVEMRLPVGQELHFQVLQRFVHRVDAAEEGGDDHGGTELGRHAVLVQIELG